METILISAETYFFSMLIITYITQKLLKIYKDKLFNDVIFYTSNLFVLLQCMIHGAIINGSRSFYFFRIPEDGFLFLGITVLFIWQLYIFAILCQRDK